MTTGHHVGISTSSSFKVLNILGMTSHLRCSRPPNCNGLHSKTFETNRQKLTTLTVDNFFRQVASLYCPRCHRYGFQSSRVVEPVTDPMTPNEGNTWSSSASMKSSRATTTAAAGFSVKRRRTRSVRADVARNARNNGGNRQWQCLTSRESRYSSLPPVLQSEKIHESQSEPYDAIARVYDIAKYDGIQHHVSVGQIFWFSLPAVTSNPSISKHLSFRHNLLSLFLT